MKFSLVEQSIAAALGCLVIAACLQLFVSQARLFVEGEQQSTQHANALLVTQILKESVDNAGHFGCRAFPFESPPLEILSEPPPSWPKSIRRRWLTGTSIINLTHLQQDLMPALPAVAGDTRLVLRGGPRLSRGQSLVVSDCKQAELVRINEVSVQAGQQVIVTHTALQHAYNDAVQASVLQKFSWFVSREHQLVQWRLGEPPEVWVDGVEAFAANWLGKAAIQVRWRQGKREYTQILGLRNA